MLVVLYMYDSLIYESIVLLVMEVFCQNNVHVHRGILVCIFYLKKDNWVPWSYISSLSHLSQGAFYNMTCTSMVLWEKIFLSVLESPWIWRFSWNMSLKVLEFTSWRSLKNLNLSLKVLESPWIWNPKYCGNHVLLLLLCVEFSPV